jgi:hypothetical protein
MLIADVIAGLALVLSVISLLWQARTWRSSGPVIRVDFQNADDSIFIHGEPTEAQIQHNRAQDRWRRHYFVVVRNRGRAPATVETIRMGIPQSASVDLVKYIVAKRSDKRPPLRIQSASAARWLIPLGPVVQGLREELDLRPFIEQVQSLNVLRAWVTLGNGDEILSPPLSPGLGRLERLLLPLTFAALALRNFRHIWRNG